MGWSCTTGDLQIGQRRGLGNDHLPFRNRPMIETAIAIPAIPNANIAMILFVRAMPLASLAASFALLARSFASLAKDVDRSSSH